MVKEGIRELTCVDHLLRRHLTGYKVLKTGRVSRGIAKSNVGRGDFATELRDEARGKVDNKA